MTLHPLPVRVEIQIDGRASLSAIRYELEKPHYSPRKTVFAAPPAVIALGRYDLGLSFYRIERYQALVRVSVADASSALNPF